MSVAGPAPERNNARVTPRQRTALPLGMLLVASTGADAILLGWSINRDPPPGVLWLL